MDRGYFDFKSVSEEPEQLDFNKLLPCPNCKKPIPHDAITCFYCGESVSRHNKPSWVFWTAVALIIIFLLFILLG